MEQNSGEVPNKEPSITSPTSDSAFSPITPKSIVSPDTLLSPRSQTVEDGEDYESGIEDGHSVDDDTLHSSVISDIAQGSDLPFQNIVLQSNSDPGVLIGWRVFVRGYGTGKILSMKRKKFTTTKFIIQFESGKVEALTLRRSKLKGDLPFTLLSKLS